MKSLYFSFIVLFFSCVPTEHEKYVTMTNTGLIVTCKTMGVSSYCDGANLTSCDDGREYDCVYNITVIHLKGE